LIDTVKAMVLEGVGRLAAHDYPRPDIGEDALLMGMELCGVCGTDIHLYVGKMSVPFPVIPGYEFVGRVEELGEGTARAYSVRRSLMDTFCIICLLIPYFFILEGVP
jgi:D-arabinose 1-dehydrogenase-like Zn-dependent alcohol dehydrogenase